MVTAANGASEYYTNDNNDVRQKHTKTLAEAITQDEETIKVKWPKGIKRGSIKEAE
jgi:hypothetical protein